MTVSTSSARHLLLRFSAPARLPDAIVGALRDEIVLAGWMRASGALSDVQIRTIDAGGTAGSARTIPGMVQVVSLEGSVGLVSGDVSCGLRAVLVRETESGLETIAGDLVDARIEALEVLVTAFDDVVATRQLDRSGVWILNATDAGAARPEPLQPERTAAQSPPAPLPPPTPASSPALIPSPVQNGFSEVVRAAEREPAPPPPAPPAPPPARAPGGFFAPPPARPTGQRPSPTFSAQAMPQRIARPVEAETEDDPVPEPGDFVEHFAFGRCEVVKTDGDRLHLRLGKDQRIKEIALEMLKVTPLPLEEGQTTRHWKLARKL